LEGVTSSIPKDIPYYESHFQESLAIRDMI